jgi:HEAT repeat protein
MLGWLSRVFGGSRPVVVEPPLAVQARSADPAQREAAAGPLAAVPEVWAGELLLKMLQDASAGVRSAAKEGLRKRGVLAAPELLTGLNHADVQVATTAAELLGEMRVADVVPPLLVALKFSARPVQIAARRALARLGTVAVPTLQAAKEDPQYWVRQQIAEILAEIDSAQPAPETAPA